MNTRRVDAPFLQKKLGELLGMDKTASGNTSVERLAFLTHQVNENMTLLKTAMAETNKAPEKKEPEKKEPEKKEPEKKAAPAHKEEVTKILADAAQKVFPENKVVEEAAEVKTARGELIMAIMTDGLEEPYAQIAKAAGIVTLNSLCRSQN